MESVISRWWFQQTFDAYLFRWVEPTRFLSDLRWLVIADFKPIRYAVIEQLCACMSELESTINACTLKLLYIYFQVILT